MDPHNKVPFGLDMSIYYGLLGLNTTGLLGPVRCCRKGDTVVKCTWNYRLCWIKLMGLCLCFLGCDLLALAGIHSAACIVLQPWWLIKNCY